MMYKENIRNVSVSDAKSEALRIDGKDDVGGLVRKYWIGV